MTLYFTQNMIMYLTAASKERKWFINGRTSVVGHH